VVGGVAKKEIKNRFWRNPSAVFYDIGFYGGLPGDEFAREVKERLE
jgi:hypothetical protein